jgi:aldehyde dehydrogenase
MKIPEPSPMSRPQPSVAETVDAVLARWKQRHAVLETPSAPETGAGIFPSVDEAVRAASAAQQAVAAASIEQRGRIIAIIRRLCFEHAEAWARMELEETRLGRLDHKIEKLLSIRHVPGVEAMRTEARSDASGLCIIEHAPWGVIGMVLPVTHSVPTLASNAINVIAAGNTAVFSPHPSGARCAAHALRAFNREIERECGIANVLTAAAHIIAGAAFDNNLLCIGEKEVFAVASIADEFIAALRRVGAVQLDAAAIERLTQAAFSFDPAPGGRGEPHLKRDLIGKDAAVLAAAAGVSAPPGTELLFGEVEEDHPFVQEEQMMPFLPVVRVPDADAGIAAALKAERGYRHTAIIHSRNVETVTRMARALNTTLFVHNAPCTASLGVNGAGYLSFSIATPTGEGVTTPLTFTRERQLAIGGALRIV